MEINSTPNVSTSTLLTPDFKKAIGYERMSKVRQNALLSWGESLVRKAHSAGARYGYSMGLPESHTILKVLRKGASLVLDNGLVFHVPRNEIRTAARWKAGDTVLLIDGTLFRVSPSDEVNPTGAEDYLVA